MSIGNESNAWTWRELYTSGIPDIINICYRGSLLTCIVKMPIQKPIAFDEAICLAHDKIYGSKVGHYRGESHWYMDHFVEWISELGFHIELTGDEFEPLMALETVA